MSLLKKLFSTLGMVVTGVATIAKTSQTDHFARKLVSYIVVVDHECRCQIQLR